MPQFSPNLIQDLFVKHAREISVFIRNRGSNEQDVADIMQESFVRLSQYPYAETVQNPKGFLFQTVANIAVDWHRRSKVRDGYAEPEADIDTLMDKQPSPESYWETRETLEQFNQWLEELPELHRHAFVLYRIEGCSYAKIARRLKVSESSAERYVKAAMNRISKHFSDDQSK